MLLCSTFKALVEAVVAEAHILLVRLVVVRVVRIPEEAAAAMRIHPVAAEAVVEEEAHTSCNDHGLQIRPHLHHRRQAG